jgi:hypothetical protein
MADRKPPANIVYRSRKMQTVGTSVNKLTRQTFGQRGLADGTIVHNWVSIVGDMLGASSQPEKITYATGQRGRGTLHLRVANSGLATEIQHLEPMVLERVNAYFGYQAVARLKLIHGPLPDPAPIAEPVLRPLNKEQTRALEDELCNVDDPELKAALKGLGQSVKGRRKDIGKK